MTLFSTISEHLARLFDPSDRICVSFIHSSRKTASGSSVTDNYCLPFSKVAGQTSIARFQVRNEDGWNCYIAMNPLLPGANHRRKELAGTPRNVFMEVDEDGDKTLAMVRDAVTAGEIPEPSTILCSSPSKYQFIWRINSEHFAAYEIEAVNEALVRRFGGDPACTDILRLFRIPGLSNLKYPERPVVAVVSSVEGASYSIADFKIPIGAARADVVKPAADDDELTAIVAYFEEAACQAGVSYSPLKKWGDGGYLWEITCPWAVLEHTGQKESGTVVILHNSGALDFSCRHSHCAERTWSKDFRPLMEKIVGHSLRFGASVPGLTMAANAPEPVALEHYTEPVSDGAVVAVSVPMATKLVNADAVTASIQTATVLPPFDTRIIKGLFSEVVGLVTNGNTLPPQFSFGVAKTIVGLRCTGRTVFEGTETQPRYYFFMIGEPGVGKGASWRRTIDVFTMANARLDFSTVIKIYNSADSGAGIKESFFTKTGQGAGVPVALYIDEIMDLGAKTRGERNPEIITTMLDLYNANSITRLKAGTDWTCHNAKLAVIMCGQPSLISTAFSGLKSGEVGWYDRLTPEIAYPQEIEDDLRPLSAQDMMKVSMAFDALPYDSVIKEDPAARSLVKEVRNTWSKEDRTSGRRLGRLNSDMYMLAFGRRSLIVEAEDALGAIYLDERQQNIREQYLREEVPDRVGDYSRRIKMMIKGQILALRDGATPESVMRTERDFMTYTNAYRKNEEVYFNRAWSSLVSTTLRVIETEKKAGPKTKYYLPV